MKRPWIAMLIETTSWPIPYWIRNIAHRRVDKYYGVFWNGKDLVKLDQNYEEHQRCSSTEQLDQHRS